MEIRHIRYFIAVAEELNFTRAAERLCIAQPPLSLQIKQLEEELNVCLFQRSKHSVALSEAGHAFLSYAHGVLALLDEARERVIGVARGECGHLKVAFNGSTSRVVLPRLFERHQCMRPEVQLILSDLTTAQQVAALERGDIHVGIARQPPRRSSILVEPIWSEPLCLVMPRGHPMSAKPRIEGAELQGMPMILCSPKHSPTLYETSLKVCRKLGFFPNVRHQLNSIYSVLSLVAAGHGVAILPAGANTLRSDDLVFRPIEGAGHSEVCLLWRADTESLAVREFVAMAKAEFLGAGHPGTPSGAPSIEVEAI